MPKPVRTKKVSHFEFAVDEMLEGTINAWRLVSRIEDWCKDPKACELAGLAKGILEEHIEELRYQKSKS